ncbi:hypothetical protein PC116_g8975 [Phytophthora cactorum]|nr:hypothetical protein PC116_g8975 [Phytophthora cactorum]
MAGSMVMRLYSGASEGVQCEGKSGPNMGIRAPAMLWQKVAHTALAEQYGIQ